MYDLTRPDKPIKRYFVAVSSNGLFYAFRSSESRIYTYACIATQGSQYDSYAYWHSRKDLGERQLRQCQKYNTIYELVKVKEVTSKEFAQIKRTVMRLIVNAQLKDFKPLDEIEVPAN
jgi:hypothetical protein